MKGVWRNDLLSTDILITIFMSLNIADLAVASLVCKMWNIACRDPSLWGKIDLSKLNNSYFFNIPNNQPGAYKRTSGKITQFLKYVPSLKDMYQEWVSANLVTRYHWGCLYNLLLG
ncbi:hypothetical protein JHK84_043245 [Glycine max]|nr:hypothetical protein JHK86_043055 [Glycine max]KAG5117132.1 hypothetical protein JHK84_043245 [Glycine max]